MYAHQFMYEFKCKSTYKYKCKSTYKYKCSLKCNSAACATPQPSEWKAVSGVLSGSRLPWRSLGRKRAACRFA